MSKRSQRSKEEVSKIKAYIVAHPKMSPKRIADRFGVKVHTVSGYKLSLRKQGHEFPKLPKGGNTDKRKKAEEFATRENVVIDEVMDIGGKDVRVMASFKQDPPRSRVKMGLDVLDNDFQICVSLGGKKHGTLILTADTVQYKTHTCAQSTEDK